MVYLGLPIKNGDFLYGELLVITRGIYPRFHLVPACGGLAINGVEC